MPSIYWHGSDDHLGEGNSPLGRVIACDNTAQRNLYMHTVDDLTRDVELGRTVEHLELSNLMIPGRTFSV